MSKNILIPWSGGMDSTYLITHSLKHGYRTNYTTFNAGQAKHTIHAENRAIQKLKKAIHEKYPNQKLINRISDLEVNFAKTKSPFKQLPAWIFNLLGMVGENGPKYDEFWLGYVPGDDAAYTVGYLEQAWEPLVKAIYGPTSDIPKLMFPIITTRKSEIYDRLEEEGLLEMVWYCELAQYSVSEDVYHVCGVCPSCFRHQQTQRDIEQSTIWRKHRHDKMFNALCAPMSDETTSESNTELIDIDSP